MEYAIFILVYLGALSILLDQQDFNKPQPDFLKYFFGRFFLFLFWWTYPIVWMIVGFRKK